MLLQMQGFFKDMNAICKVLNIGQPVFRAGLGQKNRPWHFLVQAAHHHHFIYIYIYKYIYIFFFIIIFFYYITDFYTLKILMFKNF